ncbi:hypothetical protein ATANTOWER_017196 [Ataeniobius toweri]|uniref:Uncharacterized protein n=1 Tax=Ataeniobius toweri TaxID=208326 RepID=A0ABU7APN0_9TELE|nr:hypothetical protein [Ataeniobius toweri]
MTPCWSQEQNNKSPTGLGRRGSSLSKDTQMSLSPDTSSSSSGRGPNIPRPARRQSLQCVLGHHLSLLPVGHA